MRPRGSYKKSETSRRVVLEAAVRALAERGFTRTSVSDIAAMAGMSKGAVHYHFESKDDLITEVAKHCAAVSRARVTDAWERPGTLAERMLRALEESRATRRGGSPEMRVLAELMAQALHEPKLQETIRSMFQDNRIQIADELRKAALQGPAGVSARVLPRVLLATLDGLALHDFFDPPSEAEDQEVDRALERFMTSLLSVDD